MDRQIELRYFLPVYSQSVEAFPAWLLNPAPSPGQQAADRIIAATSLVENAPLVTADKNLINAKVINTIW